MTAQKRSLAAFVAAFSFAICGTSAQADTREVNIPTGATERLDYHSVCRKVTNGGSHPIMVPVLTPDEWSSGGSAFLENVQTMDQVQVSNCGGAFAALELCGAGGTMCLHFDYWNFGAYLFKDDEPIAACFMHNNVVSDGRNLTDAQKDWVFNFWNSKVSYAGYGTYRGFPSYWSDADLDDAMKPMVKQCNFKLNGSSTFTSDYWYTYPYRYTLRALFNDPNMAYIAVDGPRYTQGYGPTASDWSGEMSSSAIAPYDFIQPEHFTSYFCMGGSSSGNRGCLTNSTYSAAGIGNTDLKANANIPLCHYETSFGLRVSSHITGGSATTYDMGVASSLNLLVPSEPWSQYVRDQFSNVAPTAEQLIAHSQAAGNGWMSFQPGSNTCRAVMRGKNWKGDNITFIAEYTKS